MHYVTPDFISLSFVYHWTLKPNLMKTWTNHHPKHAPNICIPMHALKALLNFGWYWDLGHVEYNNDCFVVPNDSTKSLWFFSLHVYEHVSLPIEPINMYVWVNKVDVDSITTLRILHHNTTQYAIKAFDIFLFEMWRKV
jgi:hypothetical protein